jgi:hypothetical protein
MNRKTVYDADVQTRSGKRARGKRARGKGARPSPGLGNP